MMRRTLTAAAVVLAAVGWLGVARAERPEGPPRGREFGPGFGPDAGMWAERLHLSEEQRAQIEALWENDRQATRPLFEAARETHEAFREALEAPNPDPTAVGQAALAMRAADRKVRAAREAGLEAIKAILTPEQRERLEQGRERGFGPPERRARGGRPPGR
jgi:Spy/CpxP family protein refolding chaperone